MTNPTKEQDMTSPNKEQDLTTVPADDVARTAELEARLTPRMRMRALSARIRKEHFARLEQEILETGAESGFYLGTWDLADILDEQEDLDRQYDISEEAGDRLAAQRKAGAEAHERRVLARREAMVELQGVLSDLGEYIGERQSDLGCDWEHDQGMPEIRKAIGRVEFALSAVRGMR